MRMSVKLALTYTFFFLPILYLVYVIYDDKRALTQFAQTEIVGAHYIDDLRAAQEALIEPNAGAQKHAADLVADAEARFRLSGEISDAAASLIASLRKPDAADFSALRSSVQDLMGKVADGSNLTLDTDLDSFYVMDASTGKVPDLVGRLTNLTASSQALAAKSNPSPDEQSQVLVLEGGLGPVLDGLGSSLDAAFKANKEGMTQRTLASPFGAVQNSTKAAMTALHQRAFGHATLDPNKVPQALADLSALGRAGSAELVRLLQARIDRIQGALMTELAIAGGLFAVGVGFALIAIQHGMVRPVTALTRVMRRLADADLTAEVPGASRLDEIGAMASAVQIFKDNALRTRELERDQAEASARRAHEDERVRTDAAQAAAAHAAAVVVGSIGKGLERLAECDLTFRLAEPLPGAYEKLRVDFNQAMDKLRDTMADVAENTTAIRSGSTEISTAATDLSQRTEKQASHLEETAAALDQITQTVRKTAEGAMRASLAVSRTQADAAQSG